MYLGVDVGGTKTLVAVLNDDGVISEKVKFPTPKKYDNFLLELRHTLAHFKQQDFKAAGIAIPGYIDREHGRARQLGNLKTWGKNLPVQRDLEHITHCPVVIENDAKLAGLSEAMLLKERFNKVLYMTVSTGIGLALISNQKIDTNIGDGGGETILVEHRGKSVRWEDIASGRAIVERYGKRAADITDDATWRKISRDIALGLVEVIAVTEPEVVVIGGGVGTYFERYSKILKAELDKYHLPVLHMPVLRSAQRPEEAVVFGCYDLAKQRFAHSAHAAV
jgi:predicted NBD/HSP70 family sugar kinase